MTESSGAPRGPLVGLFVTLCVLLASPLVSGTEPAEKPVGESREAPESQVLVTYYYTSYRCPTCKKLETYSRQAIEEGFPCGTRRKEDRFPHAQSGRTGEQPLRGRLQAGHKIPDRLPDSKRQGDQVEEPARHLETRWGSGEVRGVCQERDPELPRGSLNGFHPLRGIRLLAGRSDLHQSLSAGLERGSHLLSHQGRGSAAPCAPRRHSLQPGKGDHLCGVGCADRGIAHERSQGRLLPPDPDEPDPGAGPGPGRGVLLGWIRPGFTGVSASEGTASRLKALGYAGALLLGLLFALSFCPVSAGLFFGSLIPLSLQQGAPVALPCCLRPGDRTARAGVRTRHRLRHQGPEPGLRKDLSTRLPAGAN